MPEATVWMKKQGDTLVPTDLEGRKLLGSIQENVMVLVNARTPRNPNQHRLVWHLARLIFDNTENFESAEHVLEQIKIGTGYSTRTLLVIPGVGEVWQVRGKSIAYESMPQQEFAEWLESVLDYVAAELLPGVDRAEIVKHIEELMARRRSAEAGNRLLGFSLQAGNCRLEASVVRCAMFCEQLAKRCLVGFVDALQGIDQLDDLGGDLIEQDQQLNKGLRVHSMSPASMRSWRSAAT